MELLFEGPQGPDLYRHLVAELDKLGLAYLHVMHQGNEPLLSDMRKRRSGTLILNRPSPARELIGTDVASGLPIWSRTARWAGQPRLRGAHLMADAPLIDADRNTFFGGSERGYTDYPAFDLVEA